MLISNEMKEGQKVHVPGVIYNHLVSGFVVMIIFLNPVVLKYPSTTLNSGLNFHLHLYPFT